MSVRLPLHRRLAVRFAAMLAVTLLAFDAMADGIREVVFDLFDIPGAIVVHGSFDALPENPALLDGLTIELPPPELEAQLLEAFSLPTGPGLPPDALAPMLPFPDGDEVQVLDQAEAQRVSARMHRLAQAVSWTTTLAIALLVGLGLSRVVTGRLTGLAAEIEAGDPDPDAPPKTLPRRLLAGSDEVSEVARAWQGSRERVHDLLATLARRDRRRREWVAQVSHDLRTPLTALIAGLERGDDADLNKLRDDASRLSELVDDLVALARLEADERFEPEPLLGAELARRCLEILHPLADERGAELVLELGTASTTLGFYGQGRGILRVLENLVRNGIEHGGERIVLGLERREDAELGDRIRFLVTDDGPGFDRDTAPTGIGLRIATRFVELHGGVLAFEPSSQGTRVSFDLPVS